MSLESFRRELKYVAPQLDIMLNVETRGLEVVDLSFTPPVGVWTTWYSGGKNKRLWEPLSMDIVSRFRAYEAARRRKITAQRDRAKKERDIARNKADFADDIKDAFRTAARTMSRPMRKGVS